MPEVKFYTKSFPIEALIWIIGLMLLLLTDPAQGHISLCPLKNIGFHYCPGCGLGKSIALVLHGSFKASFQSHPLGIFTIIVLSFRVIKLVRSWIILNFN